MCKLFDHLFEAEKEFSLTIRGRGKDYRLRRSFGPKTSLPVHFRVCPERCYLVVRPREARHDSISV